MQNSAPAQSLSADEVVRRVFEDLVLADERGDVGGMSRAALSRALGVSPTQLTRILEGSRYVHPGQLARLPERIYRACMAAIESTRRPSSALTRTPASRTRQLTALLGVHAAMLDQAEADGMLDEREAAALRTSYEAIRAASEDGARDLGDVVSLKASGR